MSLREVVVWPHEALTTPAEPVEVFDEDLATLIDDMAETMYASNGVGLAANQIAVLKRVTVIDCGDEEGESALLELVNPAIIERHGKFTWQEGCLSFPELFEKIERAERVKVEFFDRHGARQEVEAEGLLAVALQHEIDHLDGIVFMERMGNLQKRLATRRFRKLLAAQDDS